MPFQQTTEEQIHFELELYLLRARLQASAKTAISSELSLWVRDKEELLLQNPDEFSVKINQKLLPDLWKNHFFCLWRSRVHAFHPSLQKLSRPPPPDLGNSRQNSACGHEFLFHWICSDLPPPSGVKCCTLTCIENRVAIHLIASFTNSITGPQADCRGLRGCKSGSYTPVIQCDAVLGKRLHPRCPNRRWIRAK